MQAADQMSTAGEYRVVPSKISGGLYQRVITYWLPSYSSTYLMCQLSNRNGKCSCEAEISYFEHTIVVQQKVLRLQIAMHDASAMTTVDS